MVSEPKSPQQFVGFFFQAYFNLVFGCSCGILIGVGSGDSHTPFLLIVFKITSLNIIHIIIIIKLMGANLSDTNVMKEVQSHYVVLRSVTDPSI